MLRHKPKLGRRTYLIPPYHPLFVIRQLGIKFLCATDKDGFYSQTVISDALYEAFVNESRRNSRNNVAVS
jgi:hypothetical protein